MYLPGQLNSLVSRIHKLVETEADIFDYVQEARGYSDQSVLAASTSDFIRRLIIKKNAIHGFEPPYLETLFDSLVTPLTFDDGTFLAFDDGTLIAF